MASATDMSARQKAAINRRFRRSEGCWPWIGVLNAKGYGHVSYRTPSGRTSTTAHRAVYELLRGPIAEHLQLDHLCRNRACVNPAHLEPVTPTENILRSAPFRTTTRKTHCPQDHPYDDVNTYVIPSTGGRCCRECNRVRLRNRRAAA